MKSVAGFTCYVLDVNKTAEFYKKLGFIIVEQDDLHLKIRLNWFTIDFVSIKHEEKEEFKKDSDATNKGAGIYIDINVEDVDEFYKGVLKMGMKPSSEPRDWPWGNREFVLRDPDGYKLVFFKKN